MREAFTVRKASRKSNSFEVGLHRCLISDFVSIASEWVARKYKIAHLTILSHLISRVDKKGPLYAIDDE
jgi:hypothetical protein